MLQQCSGAPNVSIVFLRFREKERSLHILKFANFVQALAFEGCNNMRLSGLRFINSPMMHISIHETNGAHLSDLTITAPEDSPNTDGLHIEESQQVEVLNSRIGTGTLGLNPIKTIFSYLTEKFTFFLFL